jgi:hypothetical protein
VASNQRLRSHEGLEVVVIAGDLYLVVCSTQVVSPLRERFDDGKHLEVTNPIVCLVHAELAREERYGVPVPLSVVPFRLLRQDRRDANRGGVALNAQRLLCIEMPQHGSLSKGLP